MLVACPSCRAVFEIEASIADGPGSPLCGACSGAGAAPPPPPLRRSRPKVPALHFGKRRTKDSDAAPAAETEALSIDDLDVASSPPSGSADGSPGSHVLDGGFSRSGSAISVFPASPGSPSISGAELPLSELGSDVEPVSLRDLGMVLGPAAAPPSWSGAPRTMRPEALHEKAPSREGDSSGLMDIRRIAAAAARTEPEKPSFFQVDSIPPPPSEDIPVFTEDPPPSSGHADLRSLLASDEDRGGKRAAEDLLLLNGGLFFANAQPSAERIQLRTDPPPRSPSIAPVLPLDRVAPSSRPPAALATEPRAPKSSVPGPLVSERRPARRTGTLGWVVGVVAAATVTAVVASRLAAPLEDTRDVAVTSGQSSPPQAPSVRPVSQVTTSPTPLPPPTTSAIASEAIRPDLPRSASPRERPPPPAPVTPAHVVLAPPPRPTASPAAAPPAPKPAPAGEAGELDRGAARAALAAAASMASACKEPDGPSGGARVSVTFARSGRVTSSRLAGGAFGGTKTGSCIARAFRTISVPPFSGAPVTITKDVSVR